MLDTRFNCLPTMIGSLPHTDPEKACDLVARFLPDVPAWPQLPKSSFREDMNVQYSEGFPGIIVKDKSISVDLSGDITQPLEKLYNAYLANDTTQYPINEEYAIGLHKYISLGKSSIAIKGQLVGPVTWGLSVMDSTGKAMIYNDTLSDVIPKFLRLKASWQEQILSRISKNTIIFVDEPYMTAFGSSTFTLSRENIISLINEVFRGINGIKGIHCCGNTDWSLLFATNTDIISFDTYNFAQSLSLYTEDVKKFLERKGVIAWGIIPNTSDTLQKETIASLKDRLEEAMAPFTRVGFSIKQIIEQGLLTPSCGLPGLSEEMAEYALKLLAELSQKIRGKYTG